MLSTDARRTLILGGALVALLSVHWLVSERATAVHPRQEVSVKLPGVTLDADRVAAVGLRFADGSPELLYKRNVIGWQVPQYRGAYANSHQVEGLLGSLLSAPVWPVDIGDRPMSDFGFPSRSPQILLYGAGGDLHVRVHLGGLLPGKLRRTGTYVRVEGDERIFHLGSTPLGALAAKGGVPAPMLDGKLVPTVLVPKGQMKIIRFEPAGAHEIHSIERRVRERNSDVPQDRQREMFDYFAQTARGEKQLDSRMGETYFALMTQLRYKAIPGQAGLRPEIRAPASRKVRLEYHAFRASDEEDDRPPPPPELVDFELRGEPDGGYAHVACSTTGLIYMVVQEKTGYLFPTVELLKSRPPGRTPFELAQPPIGGFRRSRLPPGFSSGPGIPEGLKLPPELQKRLGR